METPIIGVAGAKGGVGTSTVAAAIALELTQDHADVLLVDSAPGGDLDAILGLPKSDPVLGMSLRSVTPNLRILRNTTWSPEAFTDLAGWKVDVIVVDFGTVDNECLFRYTADRCEHFYGYIVTTECYVALRRVAECMPKPDFETARGVVLHTESGRSIGRADVASVLAKPVIATMDHHMSVARAIDAGVLPTRLPESLKTLGREVRVDYDFDRQSA